MEEWKEYKYSDLCLIIGGGTPKTSVTEYWNGNIPWLSVKDFNGDKKYVYETEKTITEKGLNNSSTKLLQKDDIIISARGTVGEIAMIPFPMAFNQSCFGIRANSWVNNHFLYYITKTKIEELKKSSHGSVFDTITRDTFEKLLCSIPSFEKQKRIADILSSLDDKIELNRRINENLEQQAQALFKSWFVDFEPFKDGKFVDSELGMIPEGWRVGYYTELVDIKGGGTPKTNIKEFWNGSIPFFSPKDIGPSCFVLNTEKYITTNGLENCNSNLFPPYSVFITARGTVGKVVMVGSEMAMNQSNYALLGKQNISQFYVYLITLQLVSHLLKKANGAVFNAITTRDFASERIIIPFYSIIKSFSSIVKPIYENILLNEFQIKSLSQLRDTLLPRLMSGELEIKDNSYD